MEYPYDRMTANSSGLSENDILNELIEGYASEPLVDLYKDGIKIRTRLNMLQCYAIRVAINESLLWDGTFHFQWGNDKINIDKNGQLDKYPNGLWDNYEHLLNKLI